MKPLPKVLSFDEVYIGSKIINDKYSFVLLDFNNKKLVDMLPSRHKYKLLSYFEKMQDRIVRFVESNSKISEKDFRALMMKTGELIMDVGTVLDGEEAVRCGLIDELGGLSDALDFLNSQIEEGNDALHGNES